MSILAFQNLNQFFGAVDIFTGLTASITDQAKVGLVGANGIGKTTLLRILAGLDKPKQGQVHLAKDKTVGILHQEAVTAFSNQQNSVFEEMLAVFAHLQTMAAQLRTMEQQMTQGDVSAPLLEHYGGIQEAYEQAGGYDYDVRIKQTLTGLGFGREEWGMPLDHCSGGQKTRVLLARLLLEQPDLLILDEPTNHLDVTAVTWLEGLLRSWPGTLLIVSHDRYFLDKLVNQIWEMSRNGIEMYRGNYSAYLRQREERWARRDADFTAVKNRFLGKLDFIKRNIARASSTDRAKGEMKRLIRQVQAVEYGGIEAMGMDWAKFVATTDCGFQRDDWTAPVLEQRIKLLKNPNPRTHPLKMRLRIDNQSSLTVLRTKNLQVGYADAPLFEADDIVLQRQEVVALIGPNGSGKSTFLKLLLGELEPLNGRVQLGTSVQVSYFAQAHETLTPENKVMDELLSERNIGIGAARNHLAQYLFRDEAVFKPVAALSGGERGRLALAKLALHNSNFLLLDEPTNHLDIPAQEVLEAALLTYEGTILLVSHDRYLIDKVATQIWELRDGRLHVHKGCYQAYLHQTNNNQVKSTGFQGVD